jgi:alpha-galactosidase
MKETAMSNLERQAPASEVRICLHAHTHADVLCHHVEAARGAPLTVPEIVEGEHVGGVQSECAAARHTHALHARGLEASTLSAGRAPATMAC